MAPTKRKATNQSTTEAETSNLHSVPILTAVSPEQTAAQTIGADKQVQVQRIAQEKNKAAIVNQDPELSEDDETQAAQEDEYTQTALKIKALEREKANLNAQLATKQRVATQAKKLAEARRKLAKMQAEVEQLEKACEGPQDQGKTEAHRHAHVNNLRQE